MDGQKKLLDKQNKKIKIAMFGHKRIPSREGGIEIVVEELATRMVERGNGVVVYNRRGHHVSGKEFDQEIKGEYKGVQLKTVPTIQGRGLAALTSSFFACLYAAVGCYDVVHIHAEGPALFCFLPKLFGKRVVVTIHGIDWQRAKWKGGFGEKFIRWGEKNAVKHADEIIVLSKGVQKYFQREYKRETKYISNGVNKPADLGEIKEKGAATPERTQPVKREAKIIKEKWGLEKDEYILFLGRLVPEKGLRYLIQAYKKTTQFNQEENNSPTNTQENKNDQGVRTNKKLVIAGGVSDTDEFWAELRRLAAGDERIIFTGFVQGAVLDELYSNSYLYILPSDLEGMPLSLLEAMSYGNCCVVSDIDELTEVVEDKAIVFPKGNVEELRSRLQQCCDDKEMVSGFKREAEAFILRKYDWDTVVKKTLRLYREI